MKNLKSGFSMIEVVIATLILSILMIGTMKVLSELDTSVDRELSLTQKDKIIATIIDDIRSNLAKYQVNYNYETIRGYCNASVDGNSCGPVAYLLSQELPVAWSRNSVVSVSECQSSNTCPLGRYGMVIIPAIKEKDASIPDSKAEIIPGLYEVTILFKHQRLFPNDGYHSYTFIGAIK